MTSGNEQAYSHSYYAPFMPYTHTQQQQQDGLSGAWSNGADQVPFLGGYNQQMNTEPMYSGGMTGVYNPFDFNYGWGFQGGDTFASWGNNGVPQAGAGQAKSDQTQQQQQQTQMYDQHYYGMGGAMQRDYSNMNGEMERNDGVMKSMEHSVKGMSLSDKSNQDNSAAGIQQQGAAADSNKNMSSAPTASSQQQSSNGGANNSATNTQSSAASAQPKKMTWASIASQPARPQPAMKMNSIPRAPVLPGKNIEIGTWEGKNSGMKQAPPAGRQGPAAWAAGAPRGRSGGMPGPYGPSGVPSKSSSSFGPSGSSNSGPVAKANDGPAHPLLDKLKSANMYNPKDFNLNQKGARSFIIKSYSEDDIHRSIKYSIWCSTDHGNKRLDSAYKEREGKGPVYLLFSVNGSGHFCGVAQMMSPVDYHSSSSVWAQDKWKGQFEVKWIYVKDVPNSQLRHIRLENNDNKPVTNSRDTQEVPPEKGKQVLKIIHHYRHTTSIFDDFTHYEKRQEEDGDAPAKKGPSERVSTNISPKCMH